MSSEQLADGVNPLDAELAATWDVLKGYSGRDTDLGIGRRFGGASAAYSLRDIGAMNGSVVRVRREPHDNDGVTTPSVEDETDFSANQVASGALEDWVNGKLETDLPASVNYERAVKVTISHSLIDSGNTKTLTMFVGSSSDDNTHENGFLRYYGYIGSTAYKLYNSPSAVNWRFRLESSPNTDYAVSSNNAIPENVTDVPSWENGDDGGTLNSFSVVAATPAAAAYSLRKVNSSYSGNAVRIRRSSDDIEVDVAFDSDGKVSASSAITNVAEQGGESGSTDATTLVGFLTEDVNVETSDFSSDVDGYTTAVPTHLTLSREASFEGESDVLKVVQNIGRNGITKNTVDISNENSYTITFKYYAESGYNNKYLNFGYSFANQVSPSNYVQITSGSWQTATLTMNAGFTTSATVLQLRVSDTNTDVYGTTTKDTIYYKDIVVTATNSGAFVHTWYDQAGSNDATQTTAANQPKIAESGALLADGIDFDGTDDYLEADGVSSIYTGTDEAHSSFVVVNSDAASTTQYILGIGSSTSSNPLRNTLFHSGGNIGWQVRDDAGTLKTNLSASPYVANQTYLLSALNSGTTIDFNTNSVINDNGTDADVGASTINTVHIGTRANSPTDYLNGSIQELVFYAADQSNNRFKIESNINNYYGLYNDANEVTGDFTSSGAESFTANGTDGFTLTNSTSTAFGGIELNRVLAAGEKIYVSFNLSIDAGANTSPNLNIREGSISGTTASDEGFFVPSEGFNSTVFTSDSGGDAKYISFGENDTDPSTYTISDFKVSRIARNGFVETWYDQSGSGNDATQTTASEQPLIVHNGGIVKNSKGKPSLDFIPSSDHLEVPTVIDNINTVSVFVVFERDVNSGNGTVAGQLGSDAASSRLYTPIFTASTMYFGYGDSATKINMGSYDANRTYLASFVTGDTNAEAFLDNVSKGTTAIQSAAIDTTNGAIGRNVRTSSSFPWDGQVSEVIYYKAKLQDDVADLNTDINNHYNIY